MRSIVEEGYGTLGGAKRGRLRRIKVREDDDAKVATVRAAIIGRPAQEIRRRRGAAKMFTRILKGLFLRPLWPRDWRQQEADKRRPPFPLEDRG
jgi:hypothetical protein